ncbi:MAG TPA: DedA family protein [Opitutaceae bacterium]|jgi:membrane protein DedA with SNARE-associated domain|nr:DedA family protein [Opitutaceae bacterium]
MHQVAVWYLEFKTWYMGALGSGGYPLIVLLMAMESSIVPIPAEAVVPQAAYLAHVQGHLTPIGVWLAAIVGSWVGASLMYWAARWAGRPLIVRYGPYVLVSHAKLEHAEDWCARYGAAGVFFARLLPVIRHLIGIPAGILRLDFVRYSLCTIAGSALWCGVLTGCGVYAGDNPQDIGKVKVVVVAAVAVLALLYYLLARRAKVGIDPAV